MNKYTKEEEKRILSEHNPFNKFAQNVQDLFNNKVDVEVDFQNHEGKTALMTAAFRIQEAGLEMVEQLLNYGANPNITQKNSRQTTALHYATISNNTQIIGLLLNSGADTELKDQETQMNPFETILFHDMLIPIFNFPSNLKGNEHREHEKFYPTAQLLFFAGSSYNFQKFWNMWSWYQKFDESYINLVINNLKCMKADLIKILLECVPGEARLMEIIFSYINTIE